MAPDRPILRDWLRAECARLGYVWFDQGVCNLNAIAVRRLPGTPDAFDDVLTATWREPDGSWRTAAWSCTTDPGLYWLRNPSRVEGTAVLCPGQYRGAWVIGRHHAHYPALTQTRSVCVWRDRNRNGVVNREGPRHSGYYGINVHAASLDPFHDWDDIPPRASVGRWSAGCLVLPSSHDYRQWWSWVVETTARYGLHVTLALLEHEGAVPGAPL